MIIRTRNYSIDHYMMLDFTTSAGCPMMIQFECAFISRELFLSYEEIIM